LEQRILPAIPIDVAFGEHMMAQRDDRGRGLQWRAVLSIVAVFGWLIFLVLWLSFLVTDLGDPQDLAVLIVSLLILIAALAVMWVTWGLKYPSAVQQPGYGQYGRRPRWRSALGGVSAITWLAFIIIWLFFFASGLTLYQNIAVVLASVLVVGGVNWAIGLIAR